MEKKRQTYHHKDLRNALIETGIQLVSTEGVNAFSLRKVAAACGVSHAAPYSHFQNKEELLEAMQLFITDRFSKQLESTVQKNNNVAEILKDMGIAYVSFFVENPAYFQFLYSQSNIKIDLSLSISDDQNYKPYIIYKNIVVFGMDLTGDTKIHHCFFVSFTIFQLAFYILYRTVPPLLKPW